MSAVHFGKHLFLVPRELMSCEKKLDMEELLSRRIHLLYGAWFFANNISLNCCVKSSSLHRICQSLL